MQDLKANIHFFLVGLAVLISCTSAINPFDTNLIRERRQVSQACEDAARRQQSLSDTCFGGNPTEFGQLGAKLGNLFDPTTSTTVDVDPSEVQRVFKPFCRNVGACVTALSDVITACSNDADTIRVRIYTVHKYICT